MMSMFICAICDTVCDSDEGCAEYGAYRLICNDCEDELEEGEGN